MVYGLKCHEIEEKIDNDDVLRNYHAIKTAQPISMIFVSFFSEDNVLSDEIKICCIFEYQSNENRAFRFFGTPSIVILWGPSPISREGIEGSGIKYVYISGRMVWKRRFSDFFLNLTNLPEIDGHKWEHTCGPLTCTLFKWGGGGGGSGNIMLSYFGKRKQVTYHLDLSNWCFHIPTL